MAKYVQVLKDNTARFKMPSDYYVYNGKEVEAKQYIGCDIAVLCYMISMSYVIEIGRTVYKNDEEAKVQSKIFLV